MEICGLSKSSKKLASRLSETRVGPHARSPKWAAGTLLIPLLMLAASSVQASLPAFPGAEGSGALAVGGRGGAVCKVTTLADGVNPAPEGSLRACIQMEGPRTVVFEVGGTIELVTFLVVTNPYLTIAGHTAPGGGIQLVGKTPGAIPYGASTPDNANLRGLLNIATHDVVVRYLRLRHGHVGPEGRGRTAGLTITDTGGRSVYNVIIDNVTVMWMHDENLTVWGRGTDPGIRNITVQDSLLVETLSGHATPVLVGAQRSSAGYEMEDIDFHRNVIANGTHRMPRLASGVGPHRWVNNIIYNWTNAGTRSVHGVAVDWVGNLWTSGPLPKASTGRQEIAVEVDYEECGHGLERWILDRDPSIFTSGNSGPFNGENQHEMVKRARCINGPVSGTAPAHWRRSEALRPAAVPVSVVPVSELESILLPIVGASRRLDCEGNWVENRDAQDKRFVNWYKENKGFIVKHEDDVGGFPPISNGVACADTSGDGIPDSWLLNRGLDPKVKIGRETHASGYTYLELYLMGGAGEQVGAPGAPVGIRVD